MLGCRLIVVACCTTVFSLSLSASTEAADTWKLMGDKIVPDKCEKSITYDDRAKDIQGFKLPIQIGTFSLPIEIGKFYSERKVVQPATELAEILDSRRVENCRLLQAAAGLTDRDRLLLLNDLRRDVDRLHQLAMLVVMKCEPCIRDWTKAYVDLGTSISSARAQGQRAAFRASPELERVVPFENLTP